MAHTYTRVQIDFFMPTSMTDTWYVDTEDRWVAVQTVFKRYEDGWLKYLNAVSARLTTLPGPESRERPIAFSQILKPEPQGECNAEVE